MSTDRSDIAPRLRAERERLGFAQGEFCRVLAISGETLRRYENGLREIGVEFLAQSARLGVDVQYVLTGIRSPNVAEAERAAQPAVHVSGGSANLIQNNNGNVTMIATQRHVTVTKAEVKPGDEHISTAQQAKLTALVTEIVGIESKLKQKPKSFRSVWGALNAHCEVTRYVLIASSDYDKAEKYLRQWIGRLNSMASAPVKDGDAWRKRHYAYIKINCKDDPDWLNRYLAKSFGASSLTELDNDQLERTYRAVASRKKAGK